MGKYCFEIGNIGIDGITLYEGGRECVSEAPHPAAGWHWTSKYEIRIALTQDADALGKLYKKSFPEYPYNQLHRREYHKKDVKDMVENKGHVRVVIDKKDKIIGAGDLGINSRCLLGEVRQVVVHPEHRNNGYCEQIIKTITKLSEQIGLEKVYADARTREPAIQKSLWRNGYRPVALLKGQYIVYHDPPVRENMILMVKYLNDGKERIDTKNIIIPEIREHLNII